VTEASSLVERFRLATAEPLPLPGGGSTSQRFDALRSVAFADMSLARLVEAHFDAHAIAAELGAQLVDPVATYGVWAASGPEPLTVRRGAECSTLTGVVPWCGGATIVDRALIVVPVDGRSQLFDVEVRDLEPFDDAPWTSPAFAQIHTMSMRLDATRADMLRPTAAGDYLQRPGFWHGAIGVAAVWAGGLAAVVDAHRAVWHRRDPHSLAHLGAADAELATVDAVVDRAAVAIDDAPFDMVEAERRARRVRHAVDRASVRAIDHLQTGAGPWPLAHSSEVALRTAELTMALRQCHGERDLEPLGAALLG
jgi:hypothetical protein